MVIALTTIREVPKKRDELHLDDDPKDQKNSFSRSNLNETSFAYN